MTNGSDPETLESDKKNPAVDNMKEKEDNLNAKTDDDVNIKIEPKVDDSPTVTDNEKQVEDNQDIPLRLMRFLIRKLKKILGKDTAVLYYTDIKTVEEIRKRILPSKIILFLLALCHCLLTMAPELYLIDHFLYMDEFIWFSDPQFRLLRQLIWLGSGSVLLTSGFLLQGLLSGSRIVMIATSLVCLAAGGSFAALSTLAVKFLVILGEPNPDEIMYKTVLLIPLPFISIILISMSITMLSIQINHVKAEGKSEPMWKIYLNSFNLVCLLGNLLCDQSVLGLGANWKTYNTRSIRGVSFFPSYKHSSFPEGRYDVNDYVMYLQCQTWLDSGMLLLFSLYCLPKEIKIPKLLNWLCSSGLLCLAISTAFLLMEIEDVFSSNSGIVNLKMFICIMSGIAGVYGFITNLESAFMSILTILILVAVFLIQAVCIMIDVLLVSLALLCSPVIIFSKKLLDIFKKVKKTDKEPLVQSN